MEMCRRGSCVMACHDHAQTFNNSTANENIPFQLAIICIPYADLFGPLFLVETWFKFAYNECCEPGEMSERHCKKKAVGGMDRRIITWAG
jgi:hypothetical protein